MGTEIKNAFKVLSVHVTQPRMVTRYLVTQTKTHTGRARKGEQNRASKSFRTPSRSLTYM